MVLGTKYAARALNNLDLKTVATICRAPTAFADAADSFVIEEVKRHRFSYVARAPLA